METNRKERLREFIYSRGDVSLKELEHLFPDVSSMTLRRDLAYLEGKGFIVRTRGGAMAVNRLTGPKENIYSLRVTENMDAKIKVAQKALGFIETRRSVFIDSGTTTMCLAQILPDENYSIITSGPNIGLELLKNGNASVMLLGGNLSRNNISTSGVNSIEFLKNINIDIAFMATSGLSVKSGFTSGDLNECELKKTAIKKAGKVVMLMDSSKINKNLPYTFASLKDVDVLVCDTPLPDDLQKAAQKSGVKVV